MPSKRESHPADRPSQRRDPNSQSSTSRSEPLGYSELTTLLTDSLRVLGEELAKGKSEHLQQYLDFASRFHTYSRANQWLILLQRPDATQVASYNKWKELGFQVAKGERGIRILAPSTRRVAVEPRSDQGQDQEETKEPDQKQTVVRFVAVSIFDVSQLTPEKRPPAFFTPLEGDQDALYQTLSAAAKADGFEVEESPHTGGAEGYSTGRRLVTRADLPSTNRVLTLLHEYGHVNCAPERRHSQPRF